MEMTLDRAEWRDETLPTATFPTPLALGEPGMGALVVPSPPPAEPDARSKRGGVRYAIPAVLIAGPMGFTSRTFFELDEGERAAVNTVQEVKF